MTFNVNYILDDLYRFDITWCLHHIWNLISPRSTREQLVHIIIYIYNFCYKTYIPKIFVSLASAVLLQINIRELEPSSSHLYYHYFAYVWGGKFSYSTLL